MTEPENTSEQVESSEDTPTLSGGKLVAAVLGVIILGVTCALGLNFFILPQWQTHEARGTLEKVVASRGDLQASNTKLVTFRGQHIEKANIEQKALASGAEATTPPGFIFNNGKGSKHVLDIYVDFSSGASRDFLLLNQSNLRDMVEAGAVEVRVHPLPTGNALTMYSAEAIAETMYAAPEKAWDVMFSLLKLSATVDTNKPEELIKAIASTTQEQGSRQVDSESLKNGTFASWLISVGDDPRLRTGFYPPVIYVDGKLIDPKRVNVNNADDFRRAVMQ